MTQKNQNKPQRSSLRYHVLRVVFFVIIPGYIVLSMLRWQDSKGLTASYYDNPEWKGVPVHVGQEHDIDLSRYEQLKSASQLPPTNFSISWKGWLFIDEDSSYKIMTRSDDGSSVILDGCLLVDNGGLHSIQQVKEEVFLKKGFHQLIVNYFNGPGDAVFSWQIEKDRNKAPSEPYTLTNRSFSSLTFLDRRILPYCIQGEGLYAIVISLTLGMLTFTVIRRIIQHKQTQSLVVGGLFMVGLSIAWLYAYYTIFSRLSWYNFWTDDEGFMLISFRYFLKGHALYDEVYSQYQPFVHVFNWLVFSLSGATLCHDSIRIFTIVVWLAGAVLNAVVAYRLTSSRLLSLLVLILSVLHLRIFSGAPGHPEPLAYVLVAAVVAVFAFMDQLPRSATALALGALLACLLLTKINVGVYACLPVILVLSTGTTETIASWLQVATGAIMALLPVTLMFPRLAPLISANPILYVIAPLVCGLIVLLAVLALMPRLSKITLYAILIMGIVVVVLEWHRSFQYYSLFYFAVLVTSSIASLVVISHANRSVQRIDLRIWIWTALSGGGAMGVILLVVLLRGTTMKGLLQGILWAPLTQSTILFIACRANVYSEVIALVGLASCVWYLRSKRNLEVRHSFSMPLAVVKLTFGLSVLFYFSPLGSFVSKNARLPDFWMLPFLWVLITLPGGSRSKHMSRLTLLAMAAMQSMVAYPIPQSKVVFATGLMPVIGAVLVSDAICALVSVGSKVTPYRGVWLVASGIAVLSLLCYFGYQTGIERKNYLARKSLDLPGATRIRLTDEEVHLYQNLVRPLARPEVETFLTLPGFNSLYFWAKKDPPTGFNVTAWMFLFDNQLQERIWEAASKHRGLMAVRNREKADIWVQGRPYDHLSLVRHINENFETIKVIDGYEIMERCYDKTTN